jgi:hypothetical protein
MRSQGLSLILTVTGETVNSAGETAHACRQGGVVSSMLTQRPLKSTLCNSLYVRITDATGCKGLSQHTRQPSNGAQSTGERLIDVLAEGCKRAFKLLQFTSNALSIST